MTLKNLVKGLDQMEEERREVRMILEFLAPFLLDICEANARMTKPVSTKEPVELFSLGNIRVQSELQSNGSIHPVTILQMEEGWFVTLISVDQVHRLTDDVVQTMHPLIDNFAWVASTHSIKLRQKLALVEAAAKRASK